MKIGFIGIGLMGGPLARNLIRAGKEVYIYGRNQQHINKVLSAGTTGKAVKNINDLAICDIIFTCLPLPQTVKSIMIENNGLLNQLKSGSIYIDTSTIDPSTAIEIEQYAIHRNVHYIACTLGLGPAQAETASEPLFVGGNKEIFTKIMPILNLIGSPVHYLGGVVQAYAFKIISNMIGMTNLAILAEGIHLAQKANIDIEQFLTLLAQTGGDSNQLSRRGPAIANNDFSNRFAVDLTLKDLTLGCNMAKDFNYTPIFSQKSRELYQKASEQGYGAEDCCAIYKVLE